MRATDFEFDPNVERPEPSHDKIVMYSAFPEHNLFLNAVRLLWCMLFLLMIWDLVPLFSRYRNDGG